MTLPALDAALCIGCGDCVALCPTNCLAIADRLPWLPRPADCIFCGICELVCPTGAILLADANPNEPSPVEAVESSAHNPKMRKAGRPSAAKA